VKIDAPDIQLQTTLDQLPADDPFALVIHGVWEALGIQSMPAVTLRITSTIPPAAGLGSSAAVAAALARAAASFLGHPLSDEQVSQIAYRAEQRLHGNPSGIDNTVVVYARPVYFIRAKPIEFLNLAEPLHLVIADTGVDSSTSLMVSSLRERRQADPERHEDWFDQIAKIVIRARSILETGESARLGPLMSANHALLQSLGVSCPELDRLVSAAMEAGALGAKLSGAGGGGNMIALVQAGDEERIAAALQNAGAVWTRSTTVSPRGEN
jgi:mevalonate kinase